MGTVPSAFMIRPMTGHLKRPCRAPNTTVRGNVLMMRAGSSNPFGCHAIKMPPPVGGMCSTPLTSTRRKKSPTKNRTSRTALLVVARIVR